MSIQIEKAWSTLSNEIAKALDVPVRSIELQYCWVCGPANKFTEFGGEPNFFKHEHHIVPRAFGGSDGPTVSICDSHHAATHQIALKLAAKRNYFDLLSHSKEKDKKLFWLASIICNAQALAKDDPNKPLPITFVAKGSTKIKLRALKKVLKLTQPQLMELAIHNLYTRHFQK